MWIGIFVLFVQGMVFLTSKNVILRYPKKYNDKYDLKIVQRFLGQIFLSSAIILTIFQIGFGYLG